MPIEYNKLDFWNNRLRVNHFDEKCTIFLVSAIQKMRKTTRRTKISKWIPQFEKLRTLDGIEKERIENVLDWYVEHLKDKYVPRVYSADGFRNKFFQIEAAMEKFEDDNEKETKVITAKKGKVTKHTICYHDTNKEST